MSFVGVQRVSASFSVSDGLWVQGKSAGDIRRWGAAAGWAVRPSGNTTALPIGIVADAAALAARRRNSLPCSKIR